MLFIVCFFWFVDFCLKTNRVFTGMLLSPLMGATKYWQQWSKKKTPSRQIKYIGPSRCTSLAMCSVRLSFRVTWVIVTGYCELQSLAFFRLMLWCWDPPSPLQDPATTSFPPSSSSWYLHPFVYPREHLTILVDSLLLLLFLACNKYRPCCEQPGYC